MKNLIFILSIFLLFSCQNKTTKSFTIKGNVKNVKEKSINLISFGATNQTIILDSTTIDNKGNFTLKALSNNEELYAIKIGTQQEIWLVNDCDELNLNIDNNNYKSYSTKASKKSTALHQFTHQLDSMIGLKDTLTKKYDSVKTLKKSDSLILVYKTNNENISDKLKEFCENEIKGSTSPALSYFYIFYAYKSKNIEPYLAFDYIETACKQHATSQQLQGLKNYFQLQAKENPKEYLVNKTAFDFTYYNIDSVKITPKTFSGKTLLINFWQSKNNECLKLNDKLKYLYQDYQNNGFEILSIAFDTNQVAWKKLVTKDSLKWNNTRDTLALTSNLAKQYFVKQVPFNVLINKEGKIEAIDINEADLKDKLKKKFSN